MRKTATLSSQDWYRVRRGEDQIARGRCRDLDELPLVSFSGRAAEELAFLTLDQRRAVLARLAQIAHDPYGEHSLFVLHGAGRWVAPVGELRIVFRVAPDTETVLVSTIRGGRVLDPEAVGPSPE